MSTVQEKLEGELSNFIGTEKWYRALPTDYMYTEGVKHLLDEYNFLAIFSIMVNVLLNTPQLKESEFLSIKLDRKYPDNPLFTLTFEDGNHVVLSSVQLNSNFVAESVHLFCADNVFYLPSEH